MKAREFDANSFIDFLEKANRTIPGKGFNEKIGKLVLPSSYPISDEITIAAKLGAGRASRIPYIAFLGPNMQVPNGIYPVFLYYKSQKMLILSYGISSKNAPSYVWKSLPLETKTIGEVKELLHLSKPEWIYNDSYVAKIWKVDFDEEGKPINSLEGWGSNKLIFPFHVKDVFDTFRGVLDRYKGLLWDYHLLKESKDITQGEEPIFQHSTDIPDSKGGNMEKHKSFFNINKLIEVIGSTNLLYDRELVRRYACSLMTKPFVILSGLAGSGKTQLALAFAHALSEDIDEQVCFVAVGADWTNREPLLGYSNALNRGEYVKPENGVLDIILRANDDPERPYFLILDEMNLSYVERYFADFLSAMESHKPISLWDKNSADVPEKTELPPNLFITGTINVDETTYMFSPKVLDRASVLEFKISINEMSNFLSFKRPTDINEANGKCADMGEDFVCDSLNKEFEDNITLNHILLDFFKNLKEVNAEFGYRSASEIFRYIFNLNSNPFENEDKNERMDKAIDAAIIQKLLPKLHGSRKRVVPVLKKLWSICFRPDIQEPQPLDEYTEKKVSDSQFRYPLSADKILRMFNAAIDNGFMSFAEA